MRTPQIEQFGHIIVADKNKRPNDLGWIITVGNAIHETDELNVKGKTFPYARVADGFSPLLAVGDLVIFNPFAGKALGTSVFDKNPDKEQFLLISIADVWGPMIDVQKSDWASRQEVISSPLLDSLGREVDIAAGASN